LRLIYELAPSTGGAQRAQFAAVPKSKARRRQARDQPAVFLPAFGRIFSLGPLKWAGGPPRARPLFSEHRCHLSRLPPPPATARIFTPCLLPPKLLPPARASPSLNQPREAPFTCTSHHHHHHHGAQEEGGHWRPDDLYCRVQKDARLGTYHDSHPVPTIAATRLPPRPSCQVATAQGSLVPSAHFRATTPLSPPSSFVPP